MEDGRGRTEDRRRKAEDGGQRTEVRRTVYQNIRVQAIRLSENQEIRGCSIPPPADKGRCFRLRFRFRLRFATPDGAPDGTPDKSADKQYWIPPTADNPPKGLADKPAKRIGG